MRILITGVAGFIGFSFANYLLIKKKKIKIFGIDNFDNYLSVLDDIVGVGLLTIGLVPVAAPGTTVGGELVGGPKTTFGVLL
jgi:nucleoside-diphosphate-sugar epimerase